VTFHQVDDGPVVVSIEATGITVEQESYHGIHIHMFGDLQNETDGSSVGPHFWNMQDVHGCPGNDTRHNGDMGNWWVDENGSISESKNISDMISLSGNNSIIGRAVVIHSATDDCGTASSSGSRLAFCVIGIHNMTNNAASVAYKPPVATCIMTPTSSATEDQSPMGKIWFIQTASGVEVRANISGINGTHGFHIHTSGYITADGLGSGLHYDPEGMSHGIPSGVNPRHVGDMGNIYYYDPITNDAYYSFLNDKLSLSGVNSIIGRMVHVHMDPDVCLTANGKAGSRIGQCVIGIANPASMPVVLPQGVPTTQDYQACDSTAMANPQTTANPETTAVIPQTESNDNAVGNVIPSIVFMIVLSIVALF